jgi:hypothetical protein
VGNSYRCIESGSPCTSRPAGEVATRTHLGNHDCLRLKSNSTLRPYKFGHMHNFELEGLLYILQPSYCVRKKWGSFGEPC